MKQKKQLVIQLVLLAASVALYAGTGLIKSSTVSEGAETEEENEEQAKILSFEPGEIRSIQWNNGTDEFMAEKNNGVWSLSNHPEFPLQISRIEDIAEDI